MPRVEQFDRAERRRERRPVAIMKKELLCEALLL
jgi:hypothetical protein